MKNETVRTRQTRQTQLVPGFFGIFYVFSTYPRILIEVFTRKNFGRRYFYLTKCLILAFVLGIIPYLLWMRLSGMYDDKYRYRYVGEQPPEFWKFMAPHIAGYVFLSLFLIFSFKRWLEIRHSVGFVDTEKPSYDSGEPRNFFYTFGRFETMRKEKQANLSDVERAALKYNSSWLVECILEPLPFLILGILLIKLLMPFGLVLCIAAIFYSFSYVYAYMKSTENLQDMVDELASAKLGKKLEKNVRSQTGNTLGASREPASEQPNKTGTDDPIKVT